MFKNVTLEVSLKPFKRTDSDYIKNVVREIYEGWNPLIKNRQVISIMLWTADGSEILDYKGNLDDTFEWCKYIGLANKPLADETTEDTVSLHERKRYYTDNPPEMTYRILKEIISAFKEEGKRLYPNSKITVGETFDIGPEFAVSDFKYKRHNEVCEGAVTELDGHAFINSYGILSADNYPYAGFPNGIPDKTPFGTLLGRQTKCLFDDVGFDYLWLSNGVGFAPNPWSATGAIYDGEVFHTENFEEVKSKIFGFWRSFRQECPDYPVETRGTNYSAGIDYASDAVCLYDIYNADLNILPPPNSPWAALDGDYGLELMGHMTRNAEIPGSDFMFRYYIHDPWWVNSPWYDRYNSQPHDIYLPMALARIDKSGKTCHANIFNILSIDNTLGDMPESCINEPLPHILKAEKDAADEPSPIVWVYPFREYTQTKEEYKLREMMSNDWFICQSINDGFPVSTIVSCDNFKKHDKSIYAKSIIITPVPEEDEYILDYAENGGKVIFYGSADHASKRFLNMFGISIVGGRDGEFKYDGNHFPDIHDDGIYPDCIKMREFMSNGLINTTANGTDNIYAENFALSANYKNSVWYRGYIGGKMRRDRRHVDSYDGRRFARGETLFRSVLAKFGYEIKFRKPKGCIEAPVIMINRSNNAHIFSVYSPSTTVETYLKFPLGAPILDAGETQLKDGFSTYRFNKAEHRECRVFVEQKDGIICIKEIAPVSFKYRRRILVSGLENATVRFFGENYCSDKTDAVLNSCPDGWYFADDFDGGIVKSEEFGTYFEARNVTGSIAFEMPYPDKM